jgi:glyoxylase-like metal-dependent hydrolase (beta-lactamase superfamily II)
MRPIIPGPGEPLDEALDRAGIGIDSVYAVAVSHLHWDHAGGLRHFAEQIRKLKRLAAERGYRLVPGHDPVGWPRLTEDLARRPPGVA